MSHVVAEGLAAQASPLALTEVSLKLGAGVHALLGSREDGGPLLLAVLAGRERVRKGQLTLMGRAPQDARKSVAYVPLDPMLPESLRVDEALACAAEIRGDASGKHEANAEARLGVLGIAALARRPIRSLASDEARAVALAEALTSPAVKILLIEEPLTYLDPRAASVVAERLRAKARDGVCIVVATSSGRDAGTLADTRITLARGRVARHAPANDPLATLSSDGPRMRILASDPRRLVAALAQDPVVIGVETVGRAVIARGTDVSTLCAAVGRAVIDADVDVLELRPDRAPVEELSAAAAGAAAAAYYVAYERTRAELAPARSPQHAYSPSPQQPQTMPPQAPPSHEGES